jgi:phosphoglycolate phosphatase
VNPVLDAVKAVIFDLDGTLIHSTIDFAKLKRVMIEWLRTHGVEDDALNEMGIDEGLKRGIEGLRQTHLPNAELTAAIQGLHDRLERVELENVASTRPIPGSVELLTELKRRGTRIAVLTNGFKKHAVNAVTVTGLDRYIDVLVAREEVASPPKDDPGVFDQLLATLSVERGDVLIVGDSPIDAIYAKEVRAPFIGVATSRRSKDLENAGYKHILSSVKELLPITR